MQKRRQKSEEEKTRISLLLLPNTKPYIGRRGRGRIRILVGFITTYAISVHIATKL